MNVLFLHGYKSYPNKEKVEYLESKYDKVISPTIDWDDELVRKYLFEKLSDLIISNNINMVIGGSMGGQMAFYLAQFNNINAICFNPSFDKLFFDFNFKINSNSKSIIKIISGRYDELVDPILNKEKISKLVAY